MPIATPTSTDLVARHLKGQTLHLPNLFGFYSQWPNQISPHYEQLKQTIESKIDEWISDEHVRIKARKIDLPTFCAVWYPGSTLDRLEFMAWYSLWLFLWDDVVEDVAIPISEDTNISAELQKVHWLHQHALEYAKFHLGLCEESTPEPQPPTKYCTLFKHAGASLQKGGSTIEERRKFFAALKEYMDCVEVESAYVAEKKMPSLEEYWDNRLGTSSVNTYSAVGEFMGSCQIPPHLFDTEAMHSLWFEINRHIVSMNDLVSLKKEIGKSMYSLIPVIIDETGCDLEGAVGSVVETLRISGENINKASEELLSMAERDGHNARASVEAYLYGFWTSLTGSYWWSLTCERYELAKYMQQDGTVAIPL